MLRKWIAAILLIVMLMMALAGCAPDMGRDSLKEGEAGKDNIVFVISRDNIIILKGEDITGSLTLKFE